MANYIRAVEFHGAVAAYEIVVVFFTEDDIGDFVSRLRSSVSPSHFFACVSPQSEPELPSMFGLRETPATLILREQIVLYCEPGIPSEASLLAILQQVRGLDMAKVKQEIEKERAETAIHMRRVCPTVRRGAP